MSPDDEENDYTVGYGSPPKHTQFRKGQSGNPAGRPKRSGDLKDALKNELETLVTISESGRTIRVSKAEALIKMMLAKGLSGDLRAVDILLKHSRSSLRESAEADTMDNFFDALGNALEKDPPDKAENEQIDLAPPTSHT